MTTLEDLYYGNIHPCERDIKRGTKLEWLVKLICKYEDELTATLTDRQKEILKNSKTARMNYKERIQLKTKLTPQMSVCCLAFNILP